MVKSVKGNAVKRAKPATKSSVKSTVKKGGVSTSPVPKKISAQAPAVLPPHEPEPTAVTAGARSFRSAMLLKRQARELGITKDDAMGSRQNDVGNGFWPPLSPLL